MFQTVSVKTPINFAHFLKAAGAKLTLLGLEDLETANAVIQEFPTANSAQFKEFPKVAWVSNFTITNN
jgi:hypothetical protein